MRAGYHFIPLQIRTSVVTDITKAFFLKIKILIISSFTAGMLIKPGSGSSHSVIFVTGKLRSFSRFAFYPNFASVSLDNILAYKQRYTKAGIRFFIFTFNTVESLKYFFLIEFIDANPRVFHWNNNLIFLYGAWNLYCSIIWRIFYCIGQKVRNNLSKPFTVTILNYIAIWGERNLIIWIHMTYFFYHFFN